MTPAQEIEYLTDLRDNVSNAAIEAGAVFAMDHRTIVLGTFRAVIDAKIKELKETK